MDNARSIRPERGCLPTDPLGDVNLVLADFHDGDIDNPMAPFSSLPRGPGHEVVANVVTLVGAVRRWANVWSSTTGWAVPPAPSR
jgi:hypothetical protein